MQRSAAIITRHALFSGMCCMRHARVHPVYNKVMDVGVNISIDKYVYIHIGL